MAEPPTQVARLRSSDPAALAEAVGQYHHRLYRYLYRLVRDPRRRKIFTNRPG